MFKFTIMDKVQTPDGVGTISMFERFWSDKGDADHAKVFLEGRFTARFYPLNQLTPWTPQHQQA